MTIIASGPLTMDALQTEFGGANPISMSEYYAGGNGGTVLVPSGTGSIPASGTISMSQFYGTSKLIATGYFTGGGPIATQTSRIDALVYSSLTLSRLTAVLAVARHTHSGVQSATKGYFAGGIITTYGSNTYQTEIDALIFSSNTSSNPAAVLTVAREGHLAASSSISGYFAGGSASGGATSTAIQKLTFSTEANAGIAAVLATARYYGAGCMSATKGYFGGGIVGGVYPASMTTQIDGITFSTDVAINPAAALSSARGNVGSINSALKGYWLGGRGPTTDTIIPVTEIDGITFSTEAAINPAAALAAAKCYISGVSSSAAGYVGGGIPTSGEILRQIDGLTFSTETYTTTAAVFDTGYLDYATCYSGSL